MNCLYTNYTSNNPAGININLGYYALAECLIKGTDASKALLRWCGVWFDKTKPRKMYEKSVPIQSRWERKRNGFLRYTKRIPTIRTGKLQNLQNALPKWWEKSCGKSAYEEINGTDTRKP